MKRFAIVDAIRNETRVIIESNNGKNALKQFRTKHAMSTGFYEIHKRCNRWIMSSSYGSYFVAQPIKEGV